MPTRSPGPDVVRNDLAASGYDDANRWYLVFTDFESASDAVLCEDTGGCIAITERWDSSVAGQFSHCAAGCRPNA